MHAGLIMFACVYVGCMYVGLMSPVRSFGGMMLLSKFPGGQALANMYAERKARLVYERAFCDKNGVLET